MAKIRKRRAILNIARIRHCELTGKSGLCQLSEKDLPFSTKASLTLEIYNERKAMERVLLAFAHFEKSAVQISDYKYRLTLSYDSFDETELVIRVLSFGPMVKVLEPESFKNLIRERISKQIELMK